MTNRVEITGAVLSIRMVPDALFLLRLCITNTKRRGEKTRAFQMDIFISASFLPDNITTHSPLVGKGLAIVGQLRKPKDGAVCIVVTEKATMLDRRKETTERSAEKRRLSDL